MQLGVLSKTTNKKFNPGPARFLTFLRPLPLFLEEQYNTRLRQITCNIFLNPFNLKLKLNAPPFTDDECPRFLEFLKVGFELSDSLPNFADELNGRVGDLRPETVATDETCSA